MVGRSRRDTSPTDRTLRYLIHGMDAARLSALFVGFLYVSGYFINSIFSRNYGIYKSEVFRLQYIEIGLVFFVLSTIIGGIFLGAFCVTLSIRRASRLPHYWIGGIANAANTANWISVLVFIAIFITNYEWFSTVTLWKGTESVFAHIAFAYLIIGLLGIAGLPWAERWVVANFSAPNTTLIYRSIIEPLRISVLLFSLWFDFLMYRNVPWVGPLFARSIFYILTTNMLSFGGLAAFLWLKKTALQINRDILYGMIAVGALALVYICLNAYVFGPYRFIPVNRGGKLPLSEAILNSDAANAAALPALFLKGDSHSRPVYMIEENDDFFYVIPTTTQDWLSEFVPVYAIKKTAIDSIYFKRSVTGGPRS